MVDCDCLLAGAEFISLLLVVDCCGVTLLEEPLFDERVLPISRVVLLRVDEFWLLERLFIASRFVVPALLVLALLFTSLLRVPELTVPLVAEELLVAEFTLPDLETLPLRLLLEPSGV